MRKTSLSITKAKVHGSTRFVVTVPKPGGGRSRRFFAERREAETFLQLAKVQCENFGTAALSLPEALRVEAVECAGLLLPFGKSLRDAAKFFLAHLRQRETSLPVASAVAELIEMKRAAHKSARYVKDLGLAPWAVQQDAW